MILSPDEERSLQVIDQELAEGTPHLAGMLRIFTRLHAHDAAPPDEDAVAAMPLTPPPPGPPAWRRWRARRAAEPWSGSTMGIARTTPGARLSRQGLLKPLAAIAVPAVVLVTLVLVMVFGLSSSIRCRHAPGSAAAPRRTSSLPIVAAPAFAACPASETAVNGGPGR
jgi:hypothetical protein